MMLSNSWKTQWKNEVFPIAIGRNLEARINIQWIQDSEI